MARKSIGDLPQGMIMQKLIRLPVKSLLQCKSVCKPWLSTISSPHFIQSHIHHAITTYRNAPTLLNIVNEHKWAFPASQPDELEHEQQQRRRQLINLALEDASGQDLSTSLVHFVRLLMPLNFTFSQIYSCCNGIIYLSNITVDVVHLWNPSIRQGRELIPARVGSKLNPLTIGFGYDALSCDYKLVKFGCSKWPDHIPTVQVLSLNSDSCREFQVPVLKKWMKSIQFYFAPKNVSGSDVLYFDGVDELVSFNLHDEVVGLIPFPSLVQRRKSDVLDFEGSVAMVFESETGVDLWTLDNVSGEVYWTKKFSMEYGLDEPDTDIWLSCYLGGKQFFGSKFLNGNYFCV